MATIARFCRTLTIGKFCRLFTTFDRIPLEKRLVDKLSSLNIITLTEIQDKSLESVLKGDNVIINSETGSGKTLCYLLPILNRLLHPVSTQHSPSALILVPNMDLGFQITELFNKLSDPGFFACPIHRDMKLCINPKYPVIISTPQTLLQYNIMSLMSTLQTVVIDEADLIVANGGKLLWKVLNSFRNTSQMPGNDSCYPTQFVFAAATMPHRGERSVLNRITKWLPDVAHITSSMVHQYVPTVQALDLFMQEEEKLPNLLKYLNILSKEIPVCEDLINSELNNRNDELKLGILSQQNKPLKILVFVNTISKARDVIEFLNCKEGRTIEVDNRKNNEPSVVYRHRIYQGVVESTMSNNTKIFYTKTGSSLSWNSKIGLLHKEVALTDRQMVLEKFKRNEIVVLVCTDLGSRGLHIPDVSHVIQLDYARNAADVLHRAGRTARAGAEGTGTNEDHSMTSNLVSTIQALYSAFSTRGPSKEPGYEVE